MPTLHLFQKEKGWGVYYADIFTVINFSNLLSEINRISTKLRFYFTCSASANTPMALLLKQSTMKVINGRGKLARILPNYSKTSW